MTILYIVILYLLICWYELPSLFKKELQWELIVFIAFLTPVFIMSLLLGAGIQLPYTMPAIESIVRSILSWGML